MNDIRNMHDDDFAFWLTVVKVSSTGQYVLLTPSALLEGAMTQSSVSQQYTKARIGPVA